jgi:hypothetical protein
MLEIEPVGRISVLAPGHKSNLNISQNPPDFDRIPSRGRPARTSHQLSTAAADPGMSTALRSVRLLDVLLSTPAEPSGARLVSMPVYAASLRNRVRNAGYVSDCNVTRRSSPLAARAGCQVAARETPATTTAARNRVRGRLGWIP